MIRSYLRSLACALLLQAGALATPVLYQNGTFTGSTGAWQIQDPYTMSNSFTVAGPSTASSLTFGSWVTLGSTFTQVSWSISTLASGDGTVLGSGTASVSNVLQFTITGQSVYLSTISLGRVTLNSAGTYFLTLSDAFANGGSVFWDQSNGPSTAVQTINGSFYANRASEYFVLYGVPELDRAQGSLPLTLCFLVLFSLRREIDRDALAEQPAASS